MSSNTTNYFDLFTALKVGGAKGVSPKSLLKTLKFSPGSLAVYIHALRHKFGAEIESVRDGRNVTAYRLVNIATCEKKIPSTDGRMKKAVVVTKKKKKKKVIAAIPTKKSVVAKNVVTINDDGEIPILDPHEMHDNELADIRMSLGI
jgi:hypothetical protein